MGIRKKEKPLTREERIEKIKKDSGPHWIHSEPLFGLTPSATGPQLLATSDVTDEQILVIFLLDAADYLTDRVIEVLEIWKTRYKKLAWKPVVVFQQKYIFLKNPKFFDRFKNHPVYQTLPIYLDPFGEIFEKFGSQTEPVALIMNRGQLVYSAPLSPNFAGQLLELERCLHRTLRQDDVGLPLPLLYSYEIDAPIDTRLIHAEEVTQNGQWAVTRSSLATDDPHAFLTTGFEGKSLRLVATLHPNARENAKIHITFDGAALPQNLLSPMVHTNDKGQSILEINRNTGVYEILHSKHAIRGVLKLHFHGVMETPIIFYELRQA
jgi:hypothetical protein